MDNLKYMITLSMLLSETRDLVDELYIEIEVHDTHRMDAEDLESSWITNGLIAASVTPPK